jgi:hypothetical protein
MYNKLIKYEFSFILITIFAVHQIIFLKFFPNTQGLLGGDYEAFLPYFIFGKIWFKNNLLTIPWFTPSFCCGTPFYADPQTMFYSIQQIFFILFEPIFALKLMFTYFSFIAYLGMFFLLKRSFNFSKYASLLGSTIFIFNGFFIYRAIVGHVAYLNFILIPFYCFFLFESITNKNKYLKSISLSISALIFASFFYSGSGPIMPLILSVIVVVVFFFYLKTCSLNIIKSFFLSIFLGLFISSSKISASLFFLDNFKRQNPPLIFTNIVDYLFVVFNSLFIFPDIKLFNQTASSTLGIHEIEYGVTIVPLIALFIFFFIKKNYAFFKDLKILFLVSFIIILPIIFNTNIFFLQKIIAKVPILNSTWVQIRWSAFYIIPLIFLTVFILDSFKYLKRTKIYIFLLIIIFQNIVYNKLYYHNQFYDPKNMINFSENINISGINEKINYDIRGIGFLKTNEKIYRGIRNDLFSMNLSSVYCYQPMFGYSLENFPFEKLTVNKEVDFNNGLSVTIGDLKLAPKDNKNNNVINFLNPSCFLFPKENNCNPGDLFNAQDNDNFKNFINYKPIKFNKNSVQIFFDYLSLFIFILLNIFIITNLVLYFRRSNQ